jgi:hypothetical protein
MKVEEYGRETIPIEKFWAPWDRKQKELFLNV